jgi:hypothetical protein
MPRQLVVITGPIASDKTTVAREVAAEARRRGHTAAAVDLDHLVGMLIGYGWPRIMPDDWLIARELAAGIAETLFLHEVETVIISGPFFDDDSRAHLLRGFAIAPPTLYVMLRVSLAESQRRAALDPARESAQDLGQMERLYARIDCESLPTSHVDLDTDGLPLSAVIDAVAEQVLG